uniref:Putative ovule protein n=1 Tax=Solanum chacoense TaxID=4108 RepID=A0A0V0GLN7_SOLCH
MRSLTSSFFSAFGIDLFLATSDRRLLGCGYSVPMSVMAPVLELELRRLVLLCASSYIYIICIFLDKLT